MSRPDAIAPDPRPPVPDRLAILYRDAHYLAIDKPPGLLVHRSPIDRHETRFALQMLRDQIGRWVYPLHRLDKPTSGVLLFALTPEAAMKLSTAFATGEVGKTYIAVVRGHAEPQGMIDHPLREIADPMTGGGKVPRVASTTYRRLATVELPVAVDRYPTSRYSLIEARPATGRRHQIRRHFKHIAHPVIGDTTYGKGTHNRMFEVRFGNDRLLLAATRLTFVHPYRQAALTITAPLQGTMAAVISRLGWDLPDAGRGQDRREGGGR